MPRMTAVSPAHSSAASLAHLLDARVSAKEIESYLDELPVRERVRQVLSITGRGVARLYHAVADAPPLSLDELVPPATKGTLIYEGRNSLPAFSRFQKRFLRLDGDQVIGYNHNPALVTFLTGPGYFWVRPPSGEEPHKNELFFDYTEAPPTEPPGWPAFKSNDRGLSKFVYGNMKDYMRRVARGVVVGKAYRGGVDQKAYFSLSLPEVAA
jgi:hypothetical protein